MDQAIALATTCFKMFSLQIPINSVSFGQIGFALLKQIKARGYSPCLFPIGGVDLGSFSPVDPEFKKWIDECVSNGPVKHERSMPTLKLWHINDLLVSPSKEAYGYTFHETTGLTSMETHILSQLEKVFVSSSYTKTVFESAGLNNVVYCPLGLDSDFYHPLEKDFHTDDKIVFSLKGKIEKRKHTIKILTAWGKKFGNNDKYRLDCCIQNPHYDINIQSQMINEAFGGRVPWNINFLPWQELNSTYNEVLNSSDIDLTGLSGLEGFNLPLFQSLCIGKQAVVLNAHVHKDFCNEDNSFLIEPSGLIEAHDDIFFQKGGPINQGNWFDFNEDDAISAMEEAAKVAKVKNEAGIKLSEKFTYSAMLDTLLEEVK